MLHLGRRILQRITGSDSDRRAHPRHATDIRTVCHPVSEDISIPARIADVSIGGIKLRIARPLREGTMLRVDLPRPGSPSTTMLACVMHASEVSVGVWEVGCNFSLELSDDEMRAFGGEKTQAAAGDSRAWVRHSARGTVEYEVLPAEDSSPRTAQLVNLSPAGVGLLMDEKPEVGAALVLFMKRVDDQPERQLLACVVYQTERPDGMWAIGCNFLHELSERELDELLWMSHF
jgi:PilZ domain